MDLSLVIVSLAAFLTPTLLARFKVSLIPSTVAEIIVGVIIGKSGFNIIHMNSVLDTLSTLGTIMLLFLSGMEIDFSLFKRSEPTTTLEIKKAQKAPRYSPLKIAIIAYGLTAVTSIVLGILFAVFGLFSDVFLSSILFATVSLGVMISILKENNLLGNTYGQTLLLFGVLGEIIPLLGLTIYSSIKSGNGATLWLLSLVFLAAAFLLTRFRNFFKNFNKFTKSTTQLDMRFAFLVIIILVVMAVSVGAENILGAFLAGIVIKLLEPQKSTEMKLNAIGYGLLIPFFFILTGVKLNLVTLLSSKTTLILIPLLLVAFLIAKLPSYFGLQLLFSKKNSIAGTWLAETTITLVISGVAIAQDIHALTSEQGGAFIIGAVLTCLLGPLMFKKLYQPEEQQVNKTNVHIIGVTSLSVTACQQLPSEWYDVSLYTTHQESYETFHSTAPVTGVRNLDEKTLIEEGVFDTDILVIAHIFSQTNYELALAAKKYGVERVLVRLDNPDLEETSQMTQKLEQADIEYFNTFDVGVGVLRSAIESPRILPLITSVHSQIFEFEILNPNFAGTQISQLPKDVTISRIIRQRKSLIPHGETIMQLHDHLILTGPWDKISELHTTLSNPK
ncbi:cation:proton antiporter domain-containing protein [Bombilactobacillus thymidiniphilus]|uniref:Cation:proton antiporter n=1 Tax=Bombilactobacillus thymidiniphilus TaxID=2923363 RepID=A0ABY4PF30_9LACO|nr:cation:proton antiporter [Bombilactobacillus thymidiniphilus]UQS84136.1 cation:proton antiporter [Bombilactobacillus thymidiniphilus]